MKILLIHRYFWPDAPPYAHMLRAIGGHLARCGHRVSVLSTQPSYHDAATFDEQPARETLDGIEVHRMRLLPEKKKQTGRRLVNMVLFLLRVLGHLLRHRYDLVTFSTMPPVGLGVTVRLALALTGRRGCYVYHCQDLYPEAALFGGMMREHAGYRLLRAIERTTCRAAGAVVVLSDDMRQTLLERGVEPDRIRVIDNFSLVAPKTTATAGQELPAALEPEGSQEPADTRFVVLFAGNLGRFQGLEELVEAAHRLSDRPSIVFWIVGEGAVKDELVARAGELVGRTVFFAPYQAPEVAFRIMERADLGVVSLRPNLYRVAHPSKVSTYLTAGCRLLVVAERESQLVRSIVDRDLGSWSPQGDPAAMAATIAEEAARAETVRAGRESRRAHALEAYGTDAVFARWDELLTSLESSSEPLRDGTSPRTTRP